MSRGTMVCSQLSSVAQTRTALGVPWKHPNRSPWVMRAAIQEPSVDLPTPSRPASSPRVPSARRFFQSQNTGLGLILSALVRTTCLCPSYAFQTDDLDADEGHRHVVLTSAD